MFEAISAALWERTYHDFMPLTTLQEEGNRERLRLMDIRLATPRDQLHSCPICP
jgi:hypothetical protein